MLCRRVRPNEQHLISRIRLRHDVDTMDGPPKRAVATGRAQEGEFGGILIATYSDEDSHDSRRFIRFSEPGVDYRPCEDSRRVIERARRQI